MIKNSMVTGAHVRTQLQWKKRRMEWNAINSQLQLMAQILKKIYSRTSSKLNVMGDLRVAYDTNENEQRTIMEWKKCGLGL